MNEMLKDEKKYIENYWNHNTAYHKWVLSHVKGRNAVLDVGCGDGLLVYKLSEICENVVGIDSHNPSTKKATHRLENTSNTKILNVGIEDYDEKPNSFDAIIFVASIHHMNLEYCIKKAKELLKVDGKLLIVGLANPKSVFDWVIEIGRILPSKIGDLFHEVTGDVGAPITDVKETMEDIRTITKRELPNAKIKNALYYRYLLSWVKPND